MTTGTSGRSLFYFFQNFWNVAFLRKRLNSDKKLEKFDKKNLKKNEGKRYDRKEEILEE